MNIDVKNKPIIVIALIVVALFLIALGNHYNNLTSQGNDNAHEQKLVVEDAFPFLHDGNYTNLKLFPYEGNPNKLWILRVGGLLLFNTQTGKVEKIFDATYGITGPVSAFAQVGDTIFVELSSDGGFVKINIATGKHTFYSEKDGLVNGGNLSINPDPVDPNILWIGTFQGLSRFDIRREKFTNFKEEIGTKGTTFSINNKVAVGPRYVWVSPNVNFNSKGGVARYDKETKQWFTWHGEDIGANSLFFIAENGNEAFVSGHYDIRRYIPEKNAWEVILAANSSEGRPSRVVYAPGKLFYLQNREIKYIDLADNSVHELFRDVFPDNPALDEYSIDDIRVQSFVYDEEYNRILGTAQSKKGEPLMLVYNMTDGSRSQYKITDDIVPQKFQVSRVLYSDTEIVVFLVNEQIGLFNRKNKEFIIVPEVELHDVRGVQRQNDTIAVLDAPHDFDGEYAPTVVDPAKILFISLNDAKIVKNVSVPGNPYSTQFMEKDNQVYVAYRDKVGDHVAGLLDIASLQLMEATIEVETNMLIPEMSLSHGVFYNPSRTFMIKKPIISQEDGSMTMSMRQVTPPTGWKYITLPPAPEKYNAFGRKAWGDIMSLFFENDEVLWIVTNRGIVRYDFTQGEAQTYNSQNGLVSDNISKVSVVGDSLVVTHPVGVYIYRIK